jgi:hypothetical protein
MTWKEAFLAYFEVLTIPAFIWRGSKKPQKVSG